MLLERTAGNAGLTDHLHALGDQDVSDILI